MLDTDKYTEVQSALESAQEADRDNRENVKEVELFLNKKDGQWESSILSQRGNRPRYTFDLCNPIVAQVSNPIQKSDFAISVVPTSGEASKELSRTYEGLVRNTENLSKAQNLIYNPAVKKLVSVGLAGWEIKQKYVDPKSFDQDLIIEPIQNVRESVWLEENAQMQDGSDARWGWKIIPLSRQAYKKQFPEGSMSPIGQNNQTLAYTNKPEVITVAKFYYLKPRKATLIQMSNGATYEEESKDFQKVRDDLAAQGIVEIDRRETEKEICFQRIYDGGGWLTEDEETVFEHIPLVLAYANFDIIENKIVYHGEVLHLIDSQRVLNYSETKKVEETALSPKSKIAATQKQYSAHKTSWETMNTNNEPVLPYDVDPENPTPPFVINPNNVNPGLESVSQNMRANIQGSSGMFAANMGDNLFNQSGVALERQIDQGNEGKFEYFNSMVIARERTATILVSAYPKVYDTPRQVRLLNADGTFDMVYLQDNVVDAQSGQVVSLTDFNKGIYGVTYEVGPGYKNQQQETIDAFLRMGEIDPSFILEGKDILVNQMKAPGMSQMHERIREKMVLSGQIPFEQLTEEERAKLQELAQQQDQNKQPDPLMIAALAEAKNAENDEVSNIIDMQSKQVEAAQKQQDLDRKDAELVAKVQSDQIDKMLEGQKQNAEILTVMMTQFEKLANAIGADAIVSPAVGELIEQQVNMIDEAQDRI